jgi:hypothetical protein
MDLIMNVLLGICLLASNDVILVILGGLVL